MKERRVEFNSGGDKIVGVLQLPDGAQGPMPLLIMVCGWCYTKEIVMPYYAQYFHAIGVGTLLFDYLCFGESEGGRDGGTSMAAVPVVVLVFLAFGEPAQPFVLPERIKPFPAASQ